MEIMHFGQEWLGLFHARRIVTMHRSAEIVQRAWDEDRVVIKHVADQSADAIRISFWALHRDGDVDRLATVLSRRLGRVAVTA